MGAFCRFQPILPRSSLLTICKTFIRSHLDFADVIHSQAYISWFKKVCHFYKILTEKSPSYLFNLIPNLNRTRQTRHRNNIPAIYTRHNYFNNSYFPCNISESNKQSSLQNQKLTKSLNFLKKPAKLFTNLHKQYFSYS